MKHDIKTLPKWAQELIFDQSKENERLASQICNLRKVTESLNGGRGDWFTLFHPSQGREGLLKLFILHKNCAQHVCSLEPSDFVMVCRGSKGGNE